MRGVWSHTGKGVWGGFTVAVAFRRARLCGRRRAGGVSLGLTIGGTLGPRDAGLRFVTGAGSGRWPCEVGRRGAPLRCDAAGVEIAESRLQGTSNLQNGADFEIALNSIQT